VRVGAECWIGAGALISNGLEIGGKSTVRLGAVVVKNLPPSSDVSGNFAQPHHHTLRAMLE
jgi:UDP-3-O-[3-hydroxymyristoyl] glucosamine N-acyltransferase